MKHILFILTASLMMVSCIDLPEPAPLPDPYKVPERKVKQFEGEIYTDTINGHQYIIFYDFWHGGLGLSAVHDPDCPCMK